MRGHHWLTGTRSAVLVEVPADAVPILRAFGPAPADPSAAADAAVAVGPAQAQASVDGPLALDLLPMHATGFQGAPALRGAFADGTGWAPRLSRVHTVVDGRGLTTVADDPDTGLRLHLELALDVHDVLTARAAVTNLRGRDGEDGAHDLPAATPGLGRPSGRPPTPDDYHLDALRITVPVGDQAREVASFAGRWIREFHLQRQPWGIGRIERVNVRGRTSHEDPPLLLAGSARFGQETGWVWAVHLGWSGNHELRADRTADGFAYLQAAEHLHPGEVVLRPGETYVTPTVYAVASDRGMNGVSDAFHAHVRARPVHPRTPRRVTLNTWEAVYFDHDPQRLAALADAAGDVGIERFVLDDGWFLGRRDDTAGLGDWYVDPQVHPDGLAPLAEHVRERGMQFGLWVEPEMVNPDSRLFRDDPSVALTRTSGPTTRHQHVLDIARDDLGAYLRERLDALLDETGAGYLKWDDNRDHVAAEHGGVAATHAHVVALYRLLDDLLAAHPGLEIESCSGGGGRVDLGILARTHRVWTSDCNDPIERQAIQRGASLLLPPELLGAHVGPAVSKTTGRTTSLALRLATAFFGHLGVEWDLLAASEHDRDVLGRAIALHRDWRDVLHGGRVVRVDHPDEAALVHGVVTAERGLFSYCQVHSSDWARPAAVRMPGLEPRRRYRVELVDVLTDPPAGGRPPAWYERGHVEVSGAHLADHGIALHAHHPETATVIQAVAVA
ncbi:MAG TPA: alpha-galactosidase [Egicoccus sp.]|nr:alpha-galactosidase [Egicoccus sp.]HSK24507.1 alpha-galactosidase [Egicoccus sp.]